MSGSDPKAQFDLSSAEAPSEDAGANAKPRALTVTIEPRQTQMGVAVVAALDFAARSSTDGARADDQSPIWLAVAGEDRLLHLRDTNSAAEPFSYVSGHEKPVTAIEWTTRPDLGFAIGQDGTARMLAPDALNAWVQYRTEDDELTFLQEEACRRAGRLLTDDERDLFKDPEFEPFCESIDFERNGSPQR